MEHVFTLVQRDHFVFSQQFQTDLALKFLQSFLLARLSHCFEDHFLFFFFLLLQLLYKLERLLFLLLFHLENIFEILVFFLNHQIVCSMFFFLRLKLLGQLSVHVDVNWLNKPPRHYLRRLVANLYTLNRLNRLKRLNYPLNRNWLVNCGFQIHLMNLGVVNLNLAVCTERYMALFAFKN